MLTWFVITGRGACALGVVVGLIEINNVSVVVDVRHFDVALCHGRYPEPRHYSLHLRARLVQRWLRGNRVAIEALHHDAVDLDDLTRWRIDSQLCPQLIRTETAAARAYSGE